MFGNENHSKETSGKYHRTLVLGMFSEPEKDRKGVHVILQQLHFFRVLEYPKCFRHSQNYVLSRERDLKPPPAALPQ